MPILVKRSTNWLAKYSFLATFNLSSYRVFQKVCSQKWAYFLSEFGFQWLKKACLALPNRPVLTPFPPAARKLDEEEVGSLFLISRVIAKDSRIRSVEQEALVFRLHICAAHLPSSPRRGGSGPAKARLPHKTGVVPHFRPRPAGSN